MRPQQGNSLTETASREPSTIKIGSVVYLGYACSEETGKSEPRIYVSRIWAAVPVDLDHIWHIWRCQRPNQTGTILSRPWCRKLGLPHAGNASRPWHFIALYVCMHAFDWLYLSIPHSVCLIISCRKISPPVITFKSNDCTVKKRFSMWYLHGFFTRWHRCLCLNRLLVFWKPRYVW